MNYNNCSGSSFSIDLPAMKKPTTENKSVAERLRHRSREQRVPSSSPAWTSVLR